jgi:beta-N-acetylhexosaminidase
MNGGTFIVMGIPGAVLDSETAQVIRQVQPAGFILFGRNVRDPMQLRTLLDALRSEVRHEPIITIDQEGGRVSRLKECGSEPPSAKQLRLRGDLALIEEHGTLMGELLRCFGFNLNLCPVLDVSVNGDLENSLKNRTWGETPAEVITNAKVFTFAMRATGVLSCGKHFPGYSHAAVDPHHELPQVARTKKELSEFEWPSFKALLPALDAMMIGHGDYPALDSSGVPSSLSPVVIEQLLRQEFGYRGVVISDDLDMGAIVGKYGVEDAVQQAVLAGNDLLLLCHRVEVIPQAAKALDTIPAKRMDQSEGRLNDLRTRFAPPLEPFSIEHFNRLDKQVYALREAVLGTDNARQRSADDGKRSPVEIY